MSVWDQHADFLAEEAAYLAMQDKFDATGLLNLMREAYQKAFEATSSKHVWTSGTVMVELRDGQGRLVPLPYQSVKDQLPEEGFYSDALESHIREIFDLEQDAEWHKAMVDRYESWRNDRTSRTATSSCQFEVQRFTRKEINRWLYLRGIESRYAFIKNDTNNTPSAGRVLQIDPSLLATPEELLAAFERWGLKKQWFNEPSNHLWLHAARKVKGKGGNKPIQPLYCPYEVMEGLRTESRTVRRSFTEEKGWEILEKYFPTTFLRFESFRPDHDLSKNGR